MSRNDRNASVQDHKFLENALHKKVIIASRLVCAAYRSCKKCVSAEKNSFRLFIEAESSLRMSRSLDDFESETANLD